jgi:hypothetical protein
MIKHNPWRVILCLAADLELHAACRSSNLACSCMWRDASAAVFDV